MINQTISHYTIYEKLGAGGMGEVYKAHDMKLNRDVALKFLPKDYVLSPDEVNRFEREAKAISSLNHQRRQLRGCDGPGEFKITVADHVVSVDPGDHEVTAFECQGEFVPLENRYPTGREERHHPHTKSGRSSFERIHGEDENRIPSIRSRQAKQTKGMTI